MARNRFGDQVAERPTKATQPEQRPDQQKPQREPQHETPADAKPTKRFTWRPTVIYELLKSTYASWSRYTASRMGAALTSFTIFSFAPLRVIAIDYLAY